MPLTGQARLIRGRAAVWGDAMLRWIGHQRWLRYGLRDRVIRYWRDPARCRSQTFEAPFAGFVYPGDLSRWIDWLVYYFGGYELDELNLIRRMFAHRQGAVALDVGANVGHHALYFASFCRQVHAFEPFDGVAALIHEKIARNGLSSIVVHPVGLSDADAELPYFPPADCNVGNGTFVPELAPGGRKQPACRLHVRQADRYIESLALPSVDLIKIDVEGFELHVLAGLRETLRRHRPVVMIEICDKARAAVGGPQGLASLLPPGYRVERLVRPKPLAVWFSRRDASLEPLVWPDGPTRGGYMNLLLRPT